MTAWGVLALVVALLVSIMVHEAGHFATARMFGMKATQFFVGFGPTLWSRRRGETEYGIKAIPAGGFVKIVGMTPLEEVEPGDEQRAFFRFPAWQRSIVLVAGSFMHFVLAVGITFAVIATAGLPSSRAAIGKIEPCVQRTVTQTSCTAGDLPAPAVHSGLRAGDLILALDGRKVHNYDGLAKALRAHPNQTVTLTVRRGNRTFDLRARLVGVKRPPLNDINGKQTLVGALGIAPEQFEHYSVAAAVPATGSLLKQEIVETFSSLGRNFGRIGDLFSPNRNQNSLVGVVGIARISGQEFAATSVPFAQRLAGFMLIVASVNLFVGIFNLLPLLPLDGGHLSIVLFESARSKLYRRIRRRDPGRVDLRKLLPLTYAVVAALIALTVLVMAADIFNPIQLHQ